MVAGGGWKVYIQSKMPTYLEVGLVVAGRGWKVYIQSTCRPTLRSDSWSLGEAGRCIFSLHADLP